MPVVSPNLVRTAEGDRDDALAAQSRVARSGDHTLETGQRLLDRAVHVLAVVRLRRRQEQIHLVEPVAKLERVVQPALVRDQHRPGDVVRNVDRTQDLGGV
jgi:hypothetical protein